MFNRGYIIKTVIKTLILLTFIAIQVQPSFSEEIPENEELNIDKELDKEFEWIRAETAVITTEIATKTKMDAELTPGMVTVLSGKDLKTRGIRTVYEAMTLVPGLRASINAIGDKLVSVRGIGGSLLSGNLKLMLNNVVLNDTLSTTGYVLYGIPVEQVDRIEIIRGPGSVIYGEYAYAGVINVITRQKGSEVYGYYDGNDGRGGGAAFTYENPEKELSLNLNLSGLKSDGPDVEAGEDRLKNFYGMDLSAYSYAPGFTNEAQEDRLANLSFRYKDFSILWQYLLTGNGDHFGFLHILPPDDDRIAISHEHRAVEACQRLTFSDKIDADCKAGWRRYVYNLDNVVAIPPIMNVSLPDGSTLDLTPPDGSIASPHYEERELFISSEIFWKERERNTLLAGAKYTDIATENIWVDTNTGDENPGVMERIQGEYNWIAEDRTRKIFSLYLQDMFSVTDHLTVTGGLRYDHYEDNDNSDDSLTPRISGVWQITDSHILKAQYSEAVRPPSFSELYGGTNSLFKGNKNLEPEHIRSYEFSYIYRDQKTTGRLTLFYSELKDNIAYPQYANSLGGVGIQYENANDKLSTIGFEAEFEKTLRPDLRLSANLSFADTKDEETGETLENAVEWTGNAGMIYEPLQDVMMFALQYRYVGSPHRAADDDREEVDAYHTFDLTANFFNILAKGLTFRWGIKNLFDDDVVYPAPVFKDADGNIGYYYKDDFPRAGREWWAQISYEF